MDRRGPHRRGGRDPRMDRRGPDFEQSYEHEEYDPEQDFDDDGMGPSRHPTRGVPPGRGGAGPYGMSDDMDDEMDMAPRGGHDHDHRALMARKNDWDYRTQLALLSRGNRENIRRHGGVRPEHYLPPTHLMEPGSRHGRGGSGADQNRFLPPSTMSGSRHPHAGGGGPRGPHGESLVEYVDAEAFEYGERYGGGHGDRGGGGPSHGQDRGEYPEEDEDSEDEGTSYPPASSRRHGHASREGRGGSRLR